MLNGKSANTNFIVASLTQPGFNLSVYHVGCEHANHYTTCNAGRNSQLNAYVPVD